MKTLTRKELALLTVQLRMSLKLAKTDIDLRQVSQAFLQELDIPSLNTCLCEWTQDLAKRNILSLTEVCKFHSLILACRETRLMPENVDIELFKTILDDATTSVGLNKARQQSN